MKQKLINIKDDHYVVVDDSEIKEGDWVVGCTRTVVQCMYPENVHHRDVKKITHSTQPIETFDWMGNSEKGYDTIKPLSLQEVKELIGEVDVVELSKKTTKHQKFANGLHEEVVAQMFYRKGYNQALEDNKEKKYTEEDLGLFLEYVRDNYTGMGAPHLVHNKGGQRKTKAIVQDYIQSLQPKTEWEVTFDEQGKLRLV